MNLLAVSSGLLFLASHDGQDVRDVGYIHYVVAIDVGSCLVAIVCHDGQDVRYIGNVDSTVSIGVAFLTVQIAAVDEVNHVAAEEVRCLVGANCLEPSQVSFAGAAVELVGNLTACQLLVGYERCLVDAALSVGRRSVEDIALIGVSVTRNCAGLIATGLACEVVLRENQGVLDVQGGISPTADTAYRERVRTDELAGNETVADCAVTASAVD